MSGLQNKIELARKSGYSDREILSHLANTDLAPKIKQAQEAGYGESEIIGFLGKAPPPSKADVIKAAALPFTPETRRQIGLTARYGIEGLTAIPNMVGDAVGLDSTNTVSNFLTRLGFPQAEGSTERVVGDVTRAMAGQGGVVKLGGAMAGSPGATVSRVGDLLTTAPKSQIIGAAGSAGAAGATREGGGGPVAQTVAGLAGGIVAPIAADTALTTVRAVGRGVKAAVDPFTQAGREKVVGSTLKRFSTDPSAEANLANASEMVPGSKPTTAQAARDEGLLIAERGIASANPKAGAKLARRSSEQNQARTILLSGMAGDDAAVAGAKAARDASAGGIREGAFAQKQPVDIAPVTAKIDAVIASPAGKRQTVSDAMTWLKGRLEGITDPEELYAIRQDVGDVLSGKLQGEKANLKLASSQLIEVRKVLDDAIEQGAPGFKQYLSEYSSQSKPINQMETLQDIQGKVLNAGTDAATGERVMSAAKFYNAVTKNKGELSKVLSKEQMSNLEAIGRDLDAAALSASSGKAAGSNTTQNISTAYVIGSALGSKSTTSPLIQNLSRPLNWLNKLNEEQIQDLLVDAMLEPGLAKSLMGKASSKAVESVGFELKQRAIAKGLGGLVGTSVTVGPPQSEERAR